MKRKLAATLSFALIVLTASATQAPPLQKKKVETHFCCYCRCGFADYHKECHKLCVLPESEKDNAKVRAMNKTEDRMCVEVCALKKEGRKHLEHGTPAQK